MDRGNETDGGSSQFSQASYEVKIDSFNYNTPIITYPSVDNTVIRLE